VCSSDLGTRLLNSPPRVVVPNTPPSPPPKPRKPTPLPLPPDGSLLANTWARKLGASASLFTKTLPTGGTPLPRDGGSNKGGGTSGGSNAGGGGNELGGGGAGGVTIGGGGGVTRNSGSPPS